MDNWRERTQTALMILRVRRGEVCAFEELVAVWEKRLFYFVRRIVTSEQDAWDVMQETWVKVHCGLSKLKDPLTFPAWVYRIARNTAVSHLRQNVSMQLFEEENLSQDIQTLTAEESQFDEDDAQHVHRCLDRLSLPQREALTLFFLEEFSVREMVDVTGVSAGTIKSRLYYGKKNLRALMDQQEQSHE